MPTEFVQPDSIQPIADSVSVADPMQLACKMITELNWQGAIEALRRAQLAGRDDFDIWYMIGQTKHGAKDHAGAVAAYQKAVAYQPTHQHALLMLAVSMRNAGQSEAALDVHLRLLDLYPEFSAGWTSYGSTLAAMEQYEEAAAALRESLRLNEQPQTRNLLVITLVQGGFTELAIEEGSRLLDVKSNKSVEIFDSSAFKEMKINPLPRSFNYNTPARNIISFSLWGDNPAYVHGAIINASLATHIYSGWKARFYCDRSVPSDALNELRYHGAEVIMVEDPALQSIRPSWRFLVSDDPDVDWFVCRDTDSRLNVQEFLAVEEWIHSGKAFHIMRDHICHTDLILAGMWGGMAGLLPNIREMVLSNPKYSLNQFSDQIFLGDLVWPLIKNYTLIHDSNYRLHGAKAFPYGYHLPWPLHVGTSIKGMRTWRRSK